MRAPRPLPAGSLDAIIGDLERSARDIHATLGPGLVAGAYLQCMEIELARRGRAFRRIGSALLVDDRVIAEVLSVEALLPSHCAALDAKLRAASCDVGLILNFFVVSMRDGILRFVTARPG